MERKKGCGCKITGFTVNGFTLNKREAQEEFTVNGLKWGVLLLICLFACYRCAGTCPLVGAAGEAKQPVSNASKETKEPKTSVSPDEAKQKRIAEIAKELLDIEGLEDENTSLLREDLVVREKYDKLVAEAEAIMKDLTGGDADKEEALAREILKKYAPEYYTKAMTRLATAQLIATSANLKEYKYKNGNYPSTEQGLRELTKNDAGQTPYMDERMLKDPWGNPVVYKLIDPDKYTLKSFGPDGKEGTADDIESK